MNALLLAGWIACQSLDFGTTAYALHSGHFAEANPFMRSNGYTIKIGVNVGALIWQQKVLRHRESRTQRVALPIALAASGCLAGGLNLHTLGRAQ